MNASAPPRVLIVDDESNITISLSYFLQREGFEVLSARDGEEGWEMAKAHHPDIIMLDVMMPKRDGFALCKMLRAEPMFAKIKVIMLSAKDRPSQVKHGLACGADAYITKPFRLQEVLEQIRAVSLTQ